MVEIQSIETSIKELEKSTGKEWFSVNDIKYHLIKKGLVWDDYSNSAMLNMIRKCNVRMKMKGNKYMIKLK
ncbi:hypothetical protein LCGC14_1017360 [marine sediment metagenome]|uniref:HTH HARE-type domain-containing protein n=1 Tax=marine sediment metagenome TaxID=412755 RepID=A0A0F9NK60_9ZZZZ